MLEKGSLTIGCSEKADFNVMSDHPLVTRTP